MDFLYALFLVLHSWLRWVVLLAGVGAVILALRGWLGQRPWGPLDNRVSLLYTVSLDIQFILGLVLYLGLSDLTRAAFRDFSAAMASPELRFFVLEHTFYMILALVVAHLGRVLVKRAADDLARHKRATLLFGLSFLFIVLGMPWWRPFFRLGL